MVEDVESLQETRSVLHRLAVHLLARRRAEVTGRIGLRPSPAGLATPAFGTGPEVVRVAGPALVHEVGGEHTTRPISGSTLRDLAGFVGADLEAPFDAGSDTPPIGDPDAVLHVEARAVETLASWWQIGWQVLDEVVAALPAGSAAATFQIWPEHFDGATTVTLPSGAKANLGFSPGDGYSPAPYAYVGPWEADRPGDPGYWNAPFGAVIRATEITDEASAAATCRQFMEKGLGLLGRS